MMTVYVNPARTRAWRGLGQISTGTGVVTTGLQVASIIQSEEPTEMKAFETSVAVAPLALTAAGATAMQAGLVMLPLFIGAMLMKWDQSRKAKERAEEYVEWIKAASAFVDQVVGPLTSGTISSLNDLRSRLTTKVTSVTAKPVFGDQTVPRSLPIAAVLRDIATQGGIVIGPRTDRLFGSTRWFDYSPPFIYLNVGQVAPMTGKTIAHALGIDWPGFFVALEETVMQLESPTVAAPPIQYVPTTKLGPSGAGAVLPVVAPTAPRTTTPSWFTIGPSEIVSPFAPVSAPGEPAATDTSWWWWLLVLAAAAWWMKR